MLRTIALYYAILIFAGSASCSSNADEATEKLIASYGGSSKWVYDEELGKTLHVNLLGNADNDLISKLSACPDIGAISLPLTKVTDRGVRQLSGFKKLTFLDLTSTAVTDKGFASLSGTTQLRHIHLVHTSVSDDGIAQISKLKKIRSLDASYTKVTDKSGEVIGKFETLERLEVDGVDVSDAFVLSLRNPRLSHLSLSHSKVGDKSLKHLAEMKELKTLILNDCSSITRHGLKYLSKSLSIRRLEFNSPSVNDEGLVHLAAMKSLKELELGPVCSVTENGLREFARLAPEVKVISR